MWDARQGNALAILKGHTQRVGSAAFSPDGRLVATASEDGTARLWHAASGSEIAILSGNGRGMRGVAFSPDGRRLVTGSGSDLVTDSDDGTVRLWDVAWVTHLRGEELRERVCREKLIGAHVITETDAEDPILSSVKRIDVCRQRGPLSLRYWTQAARDLWARGVRE